MTLLKQNSTEEKVKEKLIYEAQSQKKTDKAKKTEKNMNSLQWKLKEMIYHQELDKVVKQVSDRMMRTFETWNKRRVQLIKDKTESEVIEQEKKQFYDSENDDITVILNNFTPTIEEYILDAEGLKPKLAKQITVENQHKLIEAKAQDDFLKRVELQKKLVKELAKKLAVQQKLQYDSNAAMQKMANIPLMIDQKIEKIKELFDILLGKLVTPVFQPDLPDFDVNALIGLLKSFINPVISATTPLTALVGKIPIIGDLAWVMEMMSASSGSGSGTMSKAEIEKLLPKPPSIPEEILDKLKQIKDDIIAFCMTLPMILINVIMSMIDLIYSKLSIITSIIPLGSMFPLSLIPAAINSGPKILALIKVLPGMMYDLIKGVIVNKMKEAWALSFARPNNVDWETILGLAQERNAKKIAEKKKSYSDVTDEIYKNSLQKLGYTRLQAKNVQTNYKKIYNGTDSSQKKITKFQDNGKEQNIPRTTTLNSIGSNLASAGSGIVDTVSQSINTMTSLGAGAINLLTLGTTNLEGTNIENLNTTETSEDVQEQQSQNNEDIEYGVDESSITRKKPSVEDYEEYFKKLISESDLSSGLKYERIKKTRGVVGEWYEMYMKQLKKYGDEIVIEDKMEPAISMS